MSFACPLYGFLHLLISFSYPLSITGSLQMKDLLFVERRTHSSFELVKEFFNRTLLPQCDMTANLCDTNCCRDPDCRDENIEGFDCSSETDSLDTDPTFSDPYYCHSNSSDLSPIDPLLCYEIENSPFLGTYFLEERVLKRKGLEQYLERIATTGVQKYFDHIEAQGLPDHELYKYGVALKLSRSGSPLILPNEILGKGYCSHSSPVRYLLDSTSVCTSKIDAELCESNQRFNLENYFEEDDMGELHLTEIYSGNVNTSIEASVRIFCSPDVLEIEHFLALSDIYAECDDLMLVKRAKLDSVHETCTNVVRNIEYRFIWHENYLLSVAVTVVLSDVPLHRPISLIPSRQGAPSAVTQIFNVHFDKKGDVNSRLSHGSYFQNDRIVLHNFT